MSEPVTRVELEREVARLRELIETVLAERAKALELQSQEYHRRLEELNNAHARAEAAVRATVPRELFDVFVADANKFREWVVAEFSTLKGAAASSVKLFSALAVIITLIFSAITLWLRK